MDACYGSDGKNGSGIAGTGFGRLAATYGGVDASDRPDADVEIGSRPPQEMLPQTKPLWELSPQRRVCKRWSSWPTAPT